jgi:monoamine oxidase
MPDDVLIVGAGAAGLAAAGVLEREGIRPIILEARERIGGRIHTIHPSSCPVPVELGAEFVHGRPSEIWDEVVNNRLAAEELVGQRYYYEAGRLQKLSGNDRVDGVLRRMREHTEPDRPFGQFLDENCADISEDDKAWASAYVEGFNAARKEELSVQSLAAAEDASAKIGSSLNRISTGYDAVIGNLFAGCARCELRLGTVVEELRWTAGSVSARCDSGSYSARCAVVTLPLGVLQARAGQPGYIRFEPELESIRGAAAHLRVGQVLRITFEFRHRFWDWGVPTHQGGMQDLSMLFSLDPGFPTWWTSEPVKAPVITGWTSGSRVKQFSAKSAEQISRDAAASLARLLGAPAAKVEAEIVNSYMHDWQADPFARGAYSYVPAGHTAAVTLLGRSVEDTLFFAGEATHDSGRNGTVDGAIATGRRAALEVLRILRA